MPEGDVDNFKELLLAALSLKMNARARRVDRFLVERLKIGVRGIEFDFLNEILIFDVSAATESLRTTIGREQSARQNMPGRVVLRSGNSNTRLLTFFEDGSESRSLRDLYAAWNKATNATKDV